MREVFISPLHVAGLKVFRKRVAIGPRRSVAPGPRAVAGVASVLAGRITIWRSIAAVRLLASGAALPACLLIGAAPFLTRAGLLTRFAFTRSGALGIALAGVLADSPVGAWLSLSLLPGLPFCGLPGCLACSTAIPLPAVASLALLTTPLPLAGFPTITGRLATGLRIALLPAFSAGLRRSRGSARLRSAAA